MNSCFVSQLAPAEFLAEFMDYARPQVSPVEQPQFELFAQLFFNHYPLDELQGRCLSDVFGSLYSAWQFMANFDRQQPKILLFNPTLAEQGWVSSHTQLLVLQRDMPFLVDSLRIELNRRGIAIYTLKSTVMNLQRAQGQLQQLKPRDLNHRHTDDEALIVMEISAHSDSQQLAQIRASLASVLAEVERVVADYQPMRAAALAAEQNLQHLQDPVGAAQAMESKAFLRWLTEDRFTFLGYAEYDFVELDGVKTLRENPAQRLGVFALRDGTPAALAVTAFNDGMARFHVVPQPIVFGKSSLRARVHRYAYSDYVIVKRYNPQGQVIGEARFLGLYTASVYLMNPAEIPLISAKVAQVFARTGLQAASHDGKNFRQLLATFPRNEIFLSNTAELYDTLIAVARINERAMVRLFVRRDPFGKFVHFMVYVPRDDFSTKIRLAIQALLGAAIGSQECEFTTYFSESILARVYLVFKLDNPLPATLDVAALQDGIVNITRSWEDFLLSALQESQGEEASSRYLQAYRHAFSIAYQEAYDARTAVQDIQAIDELLQRCNLPNANNNSHTPIALRIYQQRVPAQHLQFKIFHLQEKLALSAVIPMLENLGFQVISESAYDIVNSTGQRVWLHDFQLAYNTHINLAFAQLKTALADAFMAIWQGDCDNDAFNVLIGRLALPWRSVMVLRAYANYMHQTLFPFSLHYLASALVNQAALTNQLVMLFEQKFLPDTTHASSASLPLSAISEQVDDARRDAIAQLQQQLLASLDAVENLNEDRIIRRFLALIDNSLRTNAYQRDEQGAYKPYLALKFSPRQLADIPEPRPLYEIFVYSPRMEGVHLRSSKVARGGLRWSDRLQDYRTEVLGLVKAQQVKNAVIVPSGAKGGFVCKKMPANATREQQQQEAISCYRWFIRGLLDLTDNFIDGRVVAPLEVVCYDENDPYLVVAADKGTASFSDIANAISQQYNHWLGDAFASGGSQGYDHKGMGITARGAWISVQRHFRELGIDVQTQAIQVVGIGDMAGDVFGNGMLQSAALKLVAAFNHQHIFIDPNPDPISSFAERKRLFSLPKSSWADYDKQLISEGGGVFERSAKAIAITPQMRACFALDATSLTPTELIHQLLQAPVDLIWNGGIGTYVKATSETHADVGDKANDNLRVNGEQLRCKVFGEGGNLGMTQRGRVEYCLKGGACNTDFIDNAGGVDCSDHEVNVKILLNEIVANGDLTQKQRNQLLADMTDAVAQLVLHNNRRQTQAISLAQQDALARAAEYRRVMNALEQQGRLNRKLEFLPTDEQLLERQAQGKALTRPELSLLISYTKAALKDDLTQATIADDDYLAGFIESAFPHKIAQLFPLALRNHRLRHEIVATQIANDMVNTMGISFAQRLSESTGASVSDIAKAYVIARDIYAMPEFLSALEQRELDLSASAQVQLMNNMMRKIRRATRWFLRNRRSYLNPATEVQLFAPGMASITEKLPDLLTGEALQDWLASVDHLRALELPEDLVNCLAQPADIYSGLSVVEAARLANQPLEIITQVYFALGNYLSLPWFASQISNLPVDNFWQAMARETYLNDLEAQLRTLTIAMVRLFDEQTLTAEPHTISSATEKIEWLIERWSQQHQLLVVRWKAMVNELQAGKNIDFAMISVALRDLLDLTQASQHCAITG